MGTGWRRHSNIAVAARRARCARNGFCFYEGILSTIGRAEVQTRCNTEEERSPQQVNGSTEIKKLSLTNTPRISAWADSYDEDDDGDECGMTLLKSTTLVGSPGESKCVSEECGMTQLKSTTSIESTTSKSPLDPEAAVFSPISSAPCFGSEDGLPSSC